MRTKIAIGYEYIGYDKRTKIAIGFMHIMYRIHRSLTVPYDGSYALSR